MATLEEVIQTIEDIEKLLPLIKDKFSRDSKDNLFSLGKSCLESCQINSAKTAKAIDPAILENLKRGFSDVLKAINMELEMEKLEEDNS